MNDIINEGEWESNEGLKSFADDQKAIQLQVILKTRNVKWGAMRFRSKKKLVLRGTVLRAQ